MIWINGVLAPAPSSLEIGVHRISIEQQGESRQEVVIELDGVKLGRVLVPSIVREGRRTGRLVIAEG